MDTLATETEKVGKRILITTSRGQEKGTYVWNQQILLDRGVIVSGSSHYWTEQTEQDKAPPIQIKFPYPTRVFVEEIKISNETLLPEGSHVTIDKLERKPWNHGGYLAGRIARGGPAGPHKAWVLISEIELPILDMA